MALGKTVLRSIDVWDIDRDPLIYGLVESFETLEVETKKGLEERESMVVDTGSSRLRVWHSAALKEAFELAKPGFVVRLEHRGKVPIKGGQTFNRISVTVWESGDIEDVAAENEKVTCNKTSRADSHEDTSR